MATEPLTKSYVNTHDVEHPLQENLTIYPLFGNARKEGVVGEIYNMETEQRMTTTEIMEKVIYK